MTMTSGLLLTLIILVLFPVAFFSIWGFVLFLLSWVSGWQRLARHYRTAQAPSGQAVGGFWAMMGFVNHRGTLRLQAAPEGLYISMMVLFRWWHPPLLIPWQAIRQRQQASGSLFKWQALELGNPPITTLQLPASLVDEQVLAGYLQK